MQEETRERGFHHPHPHPPPPLSRARDLAVSISSIFFTLLQLRGPFYIFRLVSSSMNDVRSVLKHLDNTVHCNLNSILLLDIKVT